MTRGRSTGACRFRPVGAVAGSGPRHLGGNRAEVAVVAPDRDLPIDDLEQTEEGQVNLCAAERHLVSAFVDDQVPRRDLAVDHPVDIPVAARGTRAWLARR